MRSMSPHGDTSSQESRPRVEGAEDDTFPELLEDVTPERREPTHREIAHALDVLLASYLPLVTAVLAALYLFFAIAHIFLLPLDQARLLSPANGAAGVALLAVSAVLRRSSLPAKWAHPVGAALAVLVLSSALLHMYVSGDAQQTTNLALIVLGIGLLLLSVRWGTALIVLTVVAWAAVASMLPSGTELTHYAFMLVSSSAIALLVLASRVRMLQRMTKLRHDDAYSNRLLEGALLTVRRSEAELAEAQQLARVGSWSWDIERNAVAWSAELVRIYGGGLDPSAPGYEQVLARVHPDDRSILQAAVAKALETRAPFSVVHRIVRPDGELRVLHGRGRVVATSGRPLRLVGTAQDVTDQHRAEQALRDSEAKWRSLVENAPDAITMIDRAGQILYTNRAPSGMSTDEVIGRNIDEFTPRELRESTRVAMEAVFERGENYQSPQSPLRLPTGHTQWHQSRVGPVVSNDTVVAAIVISTDVTDRRRVEEALRASETKFRGLLESAPDAIVITDSDGQIVLVNAQAEKLFGYDRAELLGQQVELLIPRRLRDRHPHHRDQYARHPQPRAMAAGVELSALRKDGSEFPAEISLSPIAFEGGSLVAAAVRDVTERQKMVQDLATARDAALESARLKSEFLANMSHEVRTPLNAILGTSGLLLDTDLPTDAREYVTMLRSSGRSLLAIVNDILDFSKIEAGMLTFETTEFDVHQVVHEAIDLLAEDARSRRIDLRALLADDIPRPVHGDPGRITQTLLNLVSNAVRFTEGGEVLVRVSCQSKSADQVLLRFAVSDTGIGIPAEAVPTLFQPFSQVDGSSRRRHGGAGLGLAISKRLVEGMGGTIDVRSTPGEGSTFGFTVPLRTVPAAAETGAVGSSRMPAKRARRPRPGTARLVGGRAVRVLIAEDNAANRKVLLRQLEKLGYTADAVTSGTEVLAALQAVPYDVILMDCQMPDMDGYETTARIRALEGPISRTPIVAVTAFALRSDREKCLHAGMDDYLSKPVDEQELAAALARWTVDGAAARPPGTSDVIDAQTLAYLRSLRRDGEDEYLPNIINQFLEDTTRRLEELDRARASDDRERVIQLAHSLKGGAALLGANRLARLCGELEANGITLKAEALGEAIRGLAAALEQVRHAVGVTHPSAGETPPTTEGSE